MGLFLATQADSTSAFIFDELAEDSPLLVLTLTLSYLEGVSHLLFAIDRSIGLSGSQ